MILVDVRYDKLNFAYDCLVDETLKVSEFITELSRFIPIDEDKVSVGAVSLCEELKQDETLSYQGVLGGDTLVVYEKDKYVICKG